MNEGIINEWSLNIETEHMITAAQEGGRGGQLKQITRIENWLVI